MKKSKKSEASAATQPAGEKLELAGDNTVPTLCNTGDGKFKIFAFCKAALTSIDWRVYALLLFTLPFAIYVWLQPFYFGYSDAQGYYRFAKYILGQDGGMLFPDRSPGPSLYLIATGVLHLDTWFFCRLGMVLMGVLMPLMAYGAVSLYTSKNAGLACGLLYLFSGVPFIYSALFMNPDHLGYFGIAITTYLVAVYLYAPKRWWYVAYLISVIAVLSYLCRPTSVYVFWIFMAVAVLFHCRQWRTLVGSALLYLLLMGSWALIDQTYLTGPFSPLALPQGVPERCVAEIYFDNDNLQFVKGVPMRQSFDVKRGPASAELPGLLLNFATSYPERWQTVDSLHPQILFSVYREHPDQMVQEVLTKPNAYYFNYLRDAIRAQKGADSDDYLLALAGEYGNAGVRRIFRFFSHNPSRLLMPCASGSALGFSNTLTHMRFLQYKQDNLHRYFTLPSATITLVNGDNGDYSAELFTGVNALLQAMPEYWKCNPCWKDYQIENTAALRNELFFPKTGVVYEHHDATIRILLCNYYGYGRAGEIYKHVIKETASEYPYSLLSFADQFIEVAMIKKFPPIDTKFCFWDLAQYSSMSIPSGGFTYPGRYNDKNYMTQNQQNELAPSIPDDWFEPLAMLCGIFFQFSGILFLLALLVFGFSLTSFPCRFSLFCATTYLYLETVITVGAQSINDRFKGQPEILVLLVLAMGVHSAVTCIRQRLAVITQTDHDVPGRAKGCGIKLGDCGRMPQFVLGAFAYLRWRIQNWRRQ